MSRRALEARRQIRAIDVPMIGNAVHDEPLVRERETDLPRGDGERLRHVSDPLNPKHVCLVVATRNEAALPLLPPLQPPP